MPLRETHAESPLGSWTSTAWTPDAGDTACPVEQIWHFDGCMAHRRERVFPHGNLELIVHLGERYRDPSTGHTFPSLVMTGVATGALLVEAPLGRSHVMGVRFRPAGAFAVLGRPIHDLTNVSVDVAELAGRAAAELGERCRSAASARDCIGIALAFALERSRRIDPDPAVAWLCARIVADAGDVRLGDVVERTGISATRLGARFRERVGVLPKRYARILRFRHALDLLAAGAASAPEAASAAGYFDQAHFNAEFRAHAGMTPGTFLRAQRYPDSASLAEDFFQDAATG